MYQFSYSSTLCANKCTQRCLHGTNAGPARGFNRSNMVTDEKRTRTHLKPRVLKRSRSKNDTSQEWNWKVTVIVLLQCYVLISLRLRFLALVGLRCKWDVKCCFGAMLRIISVSRGQRLCIRHWHSRNDITALQCTLAMPRMESYRVVNK